MFDNRIYSEVYSILELLGDNYKNKLPKNLIDMIESKKISSYNPSYNFEDLQDESKVNKKSISIIALFYLNYWANDIEKESLKELLNENERKYQEELKEKYNPDNLFKNKISDLDNQINCENTNLNQANINKNSLVIVKKNIFKKILDKIKNFFKK